MKATIHHPINRQSVLEMHTEDDGSQIVGIVGSEGEAMNLAAFDYERRQQSEDICPHHYEVKAPGPTCYVLAATISVGKEPEPSYLAYMDENEDSIKLIDGSEIFRHENGIAFAYGLPAVEPEPNATPPRQIDDGDTTNDTRAARAKAVLVHYGEINGETLLTEVVKDLLTDLGHFLDRYPSVGRLRPLFDSAGETYLTEAEGGRQFSNDKSAGTDASEKTL